ncbi:hypothetical protein [Stenotrophomonas sp.]|uniref:hypothetical protein n=1 Tax=Stenotrophomonas sp. TaxID=69392 RepID=UPI002897820C|nr:hypothetical protein [Stenotrophomonas sp.]
MSALSPLKTLALSVLCVVVALFVLGMVSGAGGWVAPWVGVGQGPGRLGWDLGWTIVGGFAACAFASRYAPTWPWLHGGIVWAMIVGASAFAAWDLGNDFPFWFVAVLLGSLPVQGLGIWFGAKFRPKH